MSRNADLSTQTFNIKNATDVLTLEFENRVVLTGSETFVPPAAATAVRFTAVGGGSAGIGTTAGAGAGLFQKTFYAPWTGDYASFQLTVGAVEGDTILANNSGTSLARAFGATAISGTNPIGVGGTSCGGDLNTSGSPGGTSPGVGGASGGLIADSTYDSTYAGRWKYFQESITNESVKNYIIGNFYISGGTETAVAIGTIGDYTIVTQEIDGQATGGMPAGLFSNGYDACTLPGCNTFTGADGKGGKGGYGGNGGCGAIGRSNTVPQPGCFYCAGSGGDGGYGGDGGTGGYYQCYCPSGAALALLGCPGGAGGYGGNGGAGSPGCGCYFVPSTGGCGGTGGFGGHGGRGGHAATHACGTLYIAGGNGGTGGFGGGGGQGGCSACAYGCGGAGGYGGGGGAMNPATNYPGCGDRSGPGGTGAIIVEWTTKEIIN